MVQIGRKAMLDQKRDRVLDILPDVCQINSYNRPILPDGNYGESIGSPVYYNNSTNIPCRIDISNRFTLGMAGMQETVTNQFVLVVPYDFPLLVDHEIIHDGTVYSVTQLMDDTSFRIVKQAMISRLGNK